MTEYPDIERFSAELDKCVTCGICHPVCPTYVLSQRELLSPRGRIILLRHLLAGDISPYEISPDAFDFCTLCYACQTACPAGVRTDLLFIATRKTLADVNGIDKSKRRIFASLDKPKRVNFAVRLGAIAQKTLGHRFVENMAGGMAVPELRSRPLLRELPEEIEPEGERRFRVGLFIGCISNYVSADAALACIEVMTRLGVEVVIPQEQVCCGAPAFNNGDFDTARRLAEINLELLKDAEVDYIVSPDATCGGAFKHEIPDLLCEDVDQALLAREIAQKTLDWTTFVLDILNPTFPDTRERTLEITISDSCHLAHTQGLHGNVRTLLERLPGVKIVEMKDSTLCCGFGGSFSALYPEDSNAWTARKVENIKEAAVPVVVVASPGCIQQIRRGLKDQRISHVKVLHPAQVIAQRCGWSY